MLRTAAPPSSHLGDLMSGPATPSLLRTASESSSVARRFSPLERLLITANGNLQRIVSSYHARPVEVRVVYNAHLPGAAPGAFKRAVDIFLLGSATAESDDDGGDDRKRGGFCFCRATSRVVVTDPRMLEALASEEVGIGQLFKHFDAFPVFTLLDVKRGTLDDPEPLLAKHSGDNTNHDSSSSSSSIDVSSSSDEDDSSRDVHTIREGEPFWRLYRLSAKGITCLIHEQFLGKVL